MSGNRTQIDYQRVFQLTPGMSLLLDTKFIILAQNEAHAKATLTEGADVIGRALFEVFPDNPSVSGAKGVSSVRQSLLNVLKKRAPDVMPIVRYDVAPERGRYEVRYWTITNTPILGEDGYVEMIINRAEDVTEIVQLRSEIL